MLNACSIVLNQNRKFNHDAGLMYWGRSKWFVFFFQRVGDRLIHFCFPHFDWQMNIETIDDPCKQLFKLLPLKEEITYFVEITVWSDKNTMIVMISSNAKRWSQQSIFTCAISYQSFLLRQLQNSLQSKDISIKFQLCTFEISANQQLDCRKMRLIIKRRQSE